MQCLQRHRDSPHITHSRLTNAYIRKRKKSSFHPALQQTASTKQLIMPRERTLTRHGRLVTKPKRYGYDDPLPEPKEKRARYQEEYELIQDVEEPMVMPLVQAPPENVATLQPIVVHPPSPAVTEINVVDDDQKSEAPLIVDEEVVYNEELEAPGNLPAAWRTMPRHCLFCNSIITRERLTTELVNIPLTMYICMNSECRAFKKDPFWIHILHKVEKLFDEMTGLPM